VRRRGRRRPIRVERARIPACSQRLGVREGELRIGGILEQRQRDLLHGVLGVPLQDEQAREQPARGGGLDPVGGRLERAPGRRSRGAEQRARFEREGETQARRCRRRHERRPLAVLQREWRDLVEHTIEHRRIACDPAACGVEREAERGRALRQGEPKERHVERRVLRGRGDRTSMMGQRAGGIVATAARERAGGVGGAETLMVRGLRGHRAQCRSQVGDRAVHEHARPGSAVGAKARRGTVPEALQASRGETARISAVDGDDRLGALPRRRRPIRRDAPIDHRAARDGHDHDDAEEQRESERHARASRREREHALGGQERAVVRRDAGVQRDRRDPEERGGKEAVRRNTQRELDEGVTCRRASCRRC